GRSSRLGRDKGRLRVGDEPILTWHRRRVIQPLDMAAAVSLPAASAEDPSLATPPSPPATDAAAGDADLPAGAEAFDLCLRDQQAYAGPLVAIEAVLTQLGALDAAWARGPVVFLPVDMVAMTERV